ncbi:Phosphoglycerate kinase [Frankliniella fusca]|uniref:Phosphoglycerate kinase n=1 Tax=Frankliniella fusca TaxID=407009 RepID=A0AAE1LSA0_9NEOP|nr:Phosphoglycerate kinase [Frankliniella fusca]
MQKFPKKNLLSKLNSTSFRFSSKVAFGAGFAISALCGSVVVVGNTVGLKITQHILQAEKKDVPLVPSPRLRALADKVKVDLQLSISQAASVDIFCSKLESSDVFGSFNSSYGALIGIPTFLLAESSKEVSYDQQFDGSLSEEEQAMELAKYKESSVWSDDAKCYIIAEGLELSRNSEHFIIPACTAFLTTGLGFSFAAFFIRKLDLFKYGFLQRNALYLAASFGFGTMALVILNTINNKYHFEKIVNRLSEKYIDAGIEYYEKVLVRCNFLNNCYLSIFDIMDVRIQSSNSTTRLERLKMKKEELSKRAIKE